MGIDTYQENADWLQARWYLPPYKTGEFFEHIESAGMTLDGFKRTRVYQEAVSKGLIVEDEWTGLYFRWGDQSFLDGLSLDAQVEYRTLHLREELLEHFADMQDKAGRGLTSEETGNVILVFASRKRSTHVDQGWINTAMANVAGIDGLVRIDQTDAWVDSFHFMSEFCWNQVAKLRLPQIWQKSDARAVWYPKRNLIVVPGQSRQNRPQLVHACTHWLEMQWSNLNAVEYVRNKLTLPGELHLIRDSLFGLRGSWLDQHDGALRGYDNDWLYEQYLNDREFSSAEIARMFSGRPTEFLAMIGQRFARADPIDIASVWSRAPDQLLLYLSIMQGNYIEL